MMEDTTEDSTEVTLFHLTPAYTDVPSELICRATALPESPVMAAEGGGVHGHKGALAPIAWVRYCFPTPCALGCTIVHRSYAWIRIGKDVILGYTFKAANSRDLCYRKKNQSRSQNPLSFPLPQPLQVFELRLG